MVAKTVVYLEVIKARGHPNIRARHRTTLEVTKESSLTVRGDCIIGVSADKSPLEFSEEFKNCIRRDDAIIVAIIEASSLRDIILAQGSPHLILTSSTKTILRKSTYIEPSTIAIRANKAAGDLRRDLVEKLKDPLTLVEIKLYCLQLSEITSVYELSRRVF
jgi:hypothetical protein